MVEIGHPEDCYCQVCIPANPLAPSRRPSSRWHLLWAVPWMLLSWLAVEVLVFLPLYLVGLAAFPIAWRWAPKTFTQSHVWADDRAIRTFSWLWLDEWLGNHEDGLLPFWWSNQGGTAYSWFLRNPVTNMRFWPIISTLPDTPRLRFCGNVVEILESPGWFVCWQGPYVGFRWQCETLGIWIGWKVQPRDVGGIPAEDYRRFGIGTACQIMRFRGKS